MRKVLISWAALVGLVGAVRANERAPAAPPPTLTLESAVGWALAHNPDLNVARKSRGIAAAGIVIARTYPFNPIWQGFVWGAGGPTSAGITNRVFNEHTFRLDLELRGQGKMRREWAEATLSRVEWEIVNQELQIAVRTVRAFNTLVYRQEKVRILEDALKVQEDSLHKVQKLVEQGQLRPADLLLARADLVETRAAIGPGRALLVAAWTDLRRLLGIEADVPLALGTLDVPVSDETRLDEVARQRRPDLRALEMAVAEAEQRIRLEVANRYGNPSVGPAFEYNETSVTFVGGWLIYALPILNTRAGDILQRRAERDRAFADQQRLATQVTLDIRAARDRLHEARKWTDYFASESLPTVRAAVETLEKLFAQGEPGVDLFRVIEGRRRLLRARDAYLDAQWELTQAQADLAAAVGDVTLALCPAPPPELSRPTFMPPVPHVP